MAAGICMCVCVCVCVCVCAYVCARERVRACVRARLRVYTHLLLEHLHPRLNGHFTPALLQDEVAEAHGDGEVS